MEGPAYARIMATERIDYTGVGLDEASLAPTPYLQARGWVADAEARARDVGDLPEPTAMAVATVDADLVPDVRVVLMRFFDERGPGFVSSTTATKAAQIAAHDGIAAVMTWVPLFRAIRFRGHAEPVAAGELAAYWESRPWGARISAWASAQSQPVASRAALESAYATYAARWPERGIRGEVPVPDDWAGWRIRCDSVEFWAGRVDRLHDRLRFVRAGVGTLDDAGAWRVERLQP